MFRRICYVIGYSILWLAVVGTVLWLLPFTKEQESQVVNAFCQENYEQMTATVECMVAYEGDGTESQQEIIENLLDSMGVAEGYEIETEQTSDKEVCKAEKTGENFKLTLKVVHMLEANQQYLYGKLYLENGVNQVLDYKDKLEAAMKGYNGKACATICMEGRRQGVYTSREKENIIQQLLTATESKLVIDGQTADYDTVYAYTNYISDSVLVNGEKINLNIAITYDEEADESCVYMAAPIINTDY